MLLVCDLGFQNLQTDEEFMQRRAVLGDGASLVRRGLHLARRLPTFCVLVSIDGLRICSATAPSTETAGGIFLTRVGSRALLY